ncbi:MAG: bifunctional diaminohydroxyphosphoribosylaminopyrimidine deaminase/5-amino-6-(5-phosphoribosylamino)uracil reductase RibD [Oligoflexales bacterium]|nr:bifunctional diaminohydroxyphosphoribosylaminopyrimidine deaminase/5-amino-6-(5-phosphoribosylamino)uracil reductase RibD [Oligoflexales bacterium]
MSQRLALDEWSLSFKEPEFLSSVTEDECIQLAAQIAWQGLGFVKTNPLVGAVAVDQNHRFLGAAAHLQYGEGHAEQNLLAKIKQQGHGDALRGGTLYCTLEPCSHFGKTPPCSRLVAESALQKLVYGFKDPNPLVAGRGLAQLESVGILCSESKLLRELSAPLLEHFFYWIEHKGELPFIGLKIAMSINSVLGFRKSETALDPKPSQWITSQRAREYGHWLRQHYESILVGAQTLIEDNPTLNVRHPDLVATNRARTPLRIVFDPNGRALKSRELSEHNLLKTEPSKTLWVCQSHFWEQENQLKQRLEQLGAETFGLKKDDSGLMSLLKYLAARGVPSLLVEGGAKTWNYFLAENLPKKLHVFMAPKVILHPDSLYFHSITQQKIELEFKQQEYTPLGSNFLLNLSR